MARVVRLPAAIEDREEAARLRAELDQEGVEWDWSAVERYQPEAMRALLAGLELDRDADRANFASASEGLADELVGFFAPPGERRPPPKGRPRTAAAEAPSPIPAEVREPTITAPRRHLMSALEADLIGPYDLDHSGSRERLALPPSRYYLMGLLAPERDREVEPTDEEEGIGAGSDEDSEAESPAEPDAKRKRWLPASIGVSVFLPPRVTRLSARVRFAEYRFDKEEECWERIPHPVYEVPVPLDARQLSGRGVRVWPVDEAEARRQGGGLHLSGQLVSAARVPGLPEGAQGLSLFVVNARAGQKHFKDERFVFQVGLELECPDGFLPRPNMADQMREAWDARVADLQFRDAFEFAVGHGVSVEGPPTEGPVTTVRTTWLPRHEVRRVMTHDDSKAVVEMARLGALGSADEVREALSPLVREYGAFIEKQAEVDLGSGDDEVKDRRDETRRVLLERAERARQRIAAGIAKVAEDAEVREAFCLANQAMADAARQRRPGEPRWRLFQLAFVLLNVESVADPFHADRETVELIFFPTGGGKTEAYLGVIAFTLLLRRLRGRERPDEGLGVAVLLRYTLRLLTLDQLARASLLICALELKRRSMPERLGQERFSIGLWVGRSATANTLKHAAKAISEYKNGSGPNPFPLPNCPWCGSRLEPNSLTVLPSPRAPESVRVACLNPECAFSGAQHEDGLPVLFVDETIYRELPSFLLATVDKFAMMPWRGETGMLFGRVHARECRRFFGPLDGKAPKGVTPLPDGVLPPELIVQDELHLISGPLGTMVGLYENAIDHLCARTDLQRGPVRPKVLAATATVRRADPQIRALFCRKRSAVFPPPGVDESETFFATVDKKSAGRLYVGVAAPGRAMRRILSRVYTALLAAARRAYVTDGPPEQTADAYMTLVGYFNSLRELGGMRRIVEDEVTARLFRSPPEPNAPPPAAIESRRPLNAAGAPHPWLRDRRIREPLELTSREKTDNVAKSKRRLEQPYANHKDRVDVLLASNMISVGVDIDRLGLMVVAGQPKTTAEYIQASSRVGRDRRWPGLVVNCLNVHKPRDRSHYEHFAAYHSCFYRYVEATSVTPFSGPALDRGLPGTLMAMARLHDPALTPGSGAMVLPARPETGDAARVRLEFGASEQPEMTREEGERLVHEVRKRIEDLLDAWKSLVDTSGDEPNERRYSSFDLDRTGGRPLLHQALDPHPPAPGSKDAKFQAPTSMRDVEASTHLWVDGNRLGRYS